MISVSAMCSPKRRATCWTVYTFLRMTSRAFAAISSRRPSFFVTSCTTAPANLPTLIGNTLIVTMRSFHGWRYLTISLPCAVAPAKSSAKSGMNRSMPIPSRLPSASNSSSAPAISAKRRLHSTISPFASTITTPAGMYLMSALDVRWKFFLR